MPTRKQRRRHQRGLRHEYEYVNLDEEGNEVPVEPAELRAEKNGQRDSKHRKGGSGKAAARRGASGRRKIEPPSWRRSARRGLLFGPVLVVAMILLNKGQPL